MWASAAINSIPDVVIAWIASDYFAIGPVGFLGVFFGLQLLYFALWIKRLSWAWLVFWLLNRRKSIEHIENFLYQNRFPRPPEYINGIDDYLSKIANDGKTAPPMRVKAASELGSLAGISLSGNGIFLMQLRIAYEAALSKYELRFPPRQPEEKPEDY